MPIFVDSNVLLDLVSQDSVWFDWSSRALEAHAAEGFLTNAMVYAELCCGAESLQEVDELHSAAGVQLCEMPREALFLASKAHLAYRRRGGSRTTGLPDFFIGAHAHILDVPLLTRDKGRYEAYFPQICLYAPGGTKGKN